jgi:hypothetical protein
MTYPVTDPSSLQSARERAHQDLADSERSQRQAAEKMARELAKVLQEVATIFDGERLEALRRTDPKVPMYWTPDDWRIFFAETSLPGVSSWGSAASPRVAELERTLAELKTRLAQTEALVRPAAPVSEAPVIQATIRDPQPARPSRLWTRQDAAKQNLPPPMPIAMDLPEEATPPLGGLLSRAREIWSALPTTCPATFQKRLPCGGRSSEDLKKAYQRCWLTLYLVGACHLNAKLEIEDLLAMVGGMASRAGSLGRIIDDLLEANILLGEIAQINSPKSSLRLLKLSPDGVRLFKILFDRDPVENDWERLIRLHEGDRFPEHTLAVLIFALHARKRGWATRILPPVEGTKAVPDLAVLRGDQSLYVEVELGQKESPTKWRNQARLNATALPGTGAGKVALCAATPETRKRLVGDCVLDKLTGLATDLETLVKVKFKEIHEDTPLWLEEW